MLYACKDIVLINKFQLSLQKNEYQGVGLDGITRIVFGNFYCITVNFEQTQHRIYVIKISLE